MQTFLNGARMDPHGFIEHFVKPIANSSLGGIAGQFGCPVGVNMIPLRYVTPWTQKNAIIDLGY